MIPARTTFTPVDIIPQYTPSTDEIRARYFALTELKQKESELEQKLEKPFIVQRIQDDIDKKIFQLKNLSKGVSHKELQK